MAFLTDVKANPQNFLSKEQTAKCTPLNRRQSLRTKSDFKEKLEQVITVPKQMTEPKPFKKPTIKPPLEDPPLPSPSPTEEYLPMDMGKGEDLEGHYDDGGYLVPIEPSKQIEEDTYEPPPSEKLVTNFAPSNHKPKTVTSPSSSLYPRKVDISLRAPLALPRNSTDERGYIRGPEDLVPPNDRNTENAPPLFPRVAPKNQRNVPFKSLASTPSPTTAKQFPKASAESESDEDVAYEHIDEQPDITSSLRPGEPNPDNPTGSITRLFSNFLKLNKKANVPRSEPIEIQTNSLDRKELPKKDSGTVRSPSVRSQSPNYTARPLPPLPTSKGHFKPPDRKERDEEPLEEYENIEKRTQFRAPKVEESEDPLEEYENIEKHIRPRTPETEDDEPLEPYENIQRHPSNGSIKSTKSRAVAPDDSFKRDKPKVEPSPSRIIDY